jgi:hypothetical protein
MVWPPFPASYLSLEEVTEIVPERSLMPPLGLITVTALCPKQWAIRLVDLAFEDLSDEDLFWADLVMVSAMQVQRDAPHAPARLEERSSAIRLSGTVETNHLLPRVGSILGPKFSHCRFNGLPCLNTALKRLAPAVQLRPWSPSLSPRSPVRSGISCLRSSSK